MKFGALVFEGGPVSGPIEGWVARAREELCLDLACRLSRIDVFDGVFVVTDRAALAERALGVPGVEAVLGEGRGFHFGRRLNEAVAELGLDAFVYMSGGSGALMSQAELEAFARAVLVDPGAIVANNVYSADMFGCCQPRMLADGGVPPVDNQVPMWAATEKGMRAVGLEPTVGASFDIDTPTDLLVFARVARALRPDAARIVDMVMEAPVGRATPRLEAAAGRLAVDLSEVALFGRVSPVTVSHLNHVTRCRIRAYSEERGMRAVGRELPGAARSRVARLAQRAGGEAVFADLAWCADAAFFDSRVFFSHMGADLSADQRFASDLFLWEDVGHRRVAEFTRAALECGIPVVLGGHCLVSGGIRALAAQAHQGDVV